MSVPAVSSVLSIAAARERAAALLEPSAPGDPSVVSDLIVLQAVDAVDPPCLLVLWQDDPWLEPQGRCTYWAQLTVLCVAGRIDPQPGIETLEQLVGYVTQRLHADPYQWGGATVGAPRLEVIGNLNYLAASVRYRLTVTTEEE